MRFKSAFAMALAAAAFTMPAHAADIYRPAPAPAPVAPAPVPPIADWSGFYVGANVGYAWGSRDFDGFIGGGQIGVNTQIDQWVLGIEADLQASGVRETRHLDEIRARAEMEWLATIRGRVGYDMGGVMPYVTGGLAMARNKISFWGPDGEHFRSSRNHTGWTIGAGLEAMLADNWSVKGEYLYADLGRKTYFADWADFEGGFRAGGDIHVVRVGVNYRFSTY